MDGSVANFSLDATNIRVSIFEHSDIENSARVVFVHGFN
ncbi:MAG: hypothetical protein ACI82Z_001939 [Cellvibrionaceae bacterium]|jgi:hypothetical protein